MRGKRSSEKTLVRVAVTQLFDCLPAVGATACELPPSKAVPGAGVGGKGKKKAEVATILPTGTAGALLVDFCKDDAQLSVLALLVLECTLSAIPPDPSQNVASGELRGLWRSLHCHCSQHSQQCQPESASSSSDAGTALAQCLGELAGVLGGNSKDCSNSNPSQPPCSLAIANKLQDVYSSCGSRTGADLLAPPAAVAELLSSVPLLLTLCCIGIDGTSTGKMSEVSTASMSLISEKELSAALRKAIAATVREISPSPRSQDSTTKSIDAKAYIFRSIAQSATMLLTSLKGNKVQYSAFAVSLISAAGELLPPIPRDDMCTHETASGCCSSADAALLVRTFRAVYSLLPYIDAPLISPALLCSAGGDLQRLLYHVSRGGDSNGDAASLSPSTAGNAELEVRYTVGTICSLLARCCAIPQFPVVSQASLSEAVSEALAVAEERSALHSLASALSRSIALCSSVVAALGPDNSSGSNQRLSAQASSQQRDQAALLSRVLVALLLRCSLENGGEECQATTTAATAVAATPFSFNTPGYLDSLLPNGENPVAAVTAAAAQVLSSFNCRVAFALGDLPGAGAGHISGTALLENVLAINRHLYRSSSTAVSAAPEVDVSITALYLRSQLHFCNVSVLSPSEQAAVEAQIREKLLSLDRSEYEATVSQLQAKSSAKTAIASKARKAASAEKIVDVADQVLKGSEALRLLCLLCAWNSHSASVAAFGDCSGSLGNSGKFSDLAVSSRDSSSGGSDSGKLVTAAVKVLKRLLSLLSSVTDHHQHASSLSSLCEVVVVNARPLMLQLYALGRTEDMVGNAHNFICLFYTL